MPIERLWPSIEVLSEEYVLVQAWKKTATHIRYHNWYADTLALDRAAVNLPQFLSELRDAVRRPLEWRNAPLRMVPAPKSQRWRVAKTTGLWGPVGGDKGVKLRPLAHAELKSQVLATAIMMCLADRVETAQRDPRLDIDNADARRSLVSYGNRLFCDSVGGELRHRWGSSKLYRGYYQDYQRFIQRPELVAETVEPGIGKRMVIVHSDLKQFYDRVEVSQFRTKLNELLEPSDDPQFGELVARVMSWQWDPRDYAEVAGYARQAGIDDFSSIALPQGLVAAGFFANAFLLDFDQELRNAIGSEFVYGLHLVDVARYVDDLRFVFEAADELSLPEIEQLSHRAIQAVLDRAAPGLQVSQEKTLAAALKEGGRPLIRQSRKMARIQSAASGGFDVAGGIEILDAVQGLIRAQERYSEGFCRDSGERLKATFVVGPPQKARE